MYALHARMAGAMGRTSNHIVSTRIHVRALDACDWVDAYTHTHAIRIGMHGVTEALPLRMTSVAAAAPLAGRA